MLSILVCLLFSVPVVYAPLEVGCFLSTGVFGTGLSTSYMNRFYSPLIRCTALHCTALYTGGRPKE